MGKEAKKSRLTMPPAEGVLLHACCAPCSAAIVEWQMAHEIRPVIYYYNPNIYPREEYEKRRDESRRHAEKLGLEWIEGEYDHEKWKAAVAGHEGDPERGDRCQLCFNMRMIASAEMAKKTGRGCIATTLASSRWKRQDQIDKAGEMAQKLTGVEYWGQNWRIEGLTERRAALLRENGFYNQLYCGCEYSMRGVEEKGKKDNEGKKEGE